MKRGADENVWKKKRSLSIAGGNINLMQTL